MKKNSLKSYQESGEKFNNFLTFKMLIKDCFLTNENLLKYERNFYVLQK